MGPCQQEFNSTSSSIPQDNVSITSKESEIPNTSATGTALQAVDSKEQVHSLVDTVGEVSESLPLPQGMLQVADGGIHKDGPELEKADLNPEEPTSVDADLLDPTGSLTIMNTVGILESVVNSPSIVLDKIGPVSARISDLERIVAGVKEKSPIVCENTIEKENNLLFTTSSPQIPSILEWRELEKTGAVFVPVLFASLALLYISLISVVAYSCLLLLALVVSCKIYFYVMNNLLNEPTLDPLAEVYILDLSLSPDSVVSMFTYLTDILNSGLSEIRRLLLAESIIDTAKFGVCLYCLTHIGSWFNLLTLVIVSWVTLFTLPKIYLNNQASIDHITDRVKTQLMILKEKVVTIFPTSVKSTTLKKQK